MDDTQIECPRCGATFYYELTRCPKCSLNLYPTGEVGMDMQEGWAEKEILENNDPREQSSPEITLSILSISIGWLAAGFVSFLFHYILSRIYSASTISLLGQLILIFAELTGALVGGYTASAIVKHHPFLHSFIVTLLAGGNAILLESFWREITFRMLFQPVSWLVGSAILISGLFGAFIFIRFQREAGIRNLFQPSKPETDLYQNLLVKVSYDREIAERLIDYERKRAPTANRSVLLRNALDRWERDN